MKKMNNDEPVDISRRDALKKMGAGAAALAVSSAFVGPLMQACAEDDHIVLDENRMRDLQFAGAWMRKMIESIEAQYHADKDDIISVRDMMRGCSRVCFERQRLDVLIKRGDSQGFLRMLNEDLGWTFEFESSNEIIVRANNTKCLCAICRVSEGKVGPSLCICSETEVERMFSVAYGCRTKVRLLDSILRGGKMCVYHVTLFG